MKNIIEERIQQLKKNVDKQRELIIVINHSIENEHFSPNEYQKNLIDDMCSQGKQYITEIERLEKLKKSIL